MKDSSTRQLRNRWIGTLHGIILLHIVLIGVGQFLPDEMITSGQKVISWYVDPLFTQKWTMFAPEPLTFSNQIIYWCATDPIPNMLMDPEKKAHAAMASIALQKKIFYFEFYATTILEEYKKFAKKNACDPEQVVCSNAFALSFPSRPVARYLKAVLTDQCGGRSPVKVELNIVNSKDILAKSSIETMQRILLWNI